MVNFLHKTQFWLYIHHWYISWTCDICAYHLMLSDSFDSFWLWCCFMLILKSGSAFGWFWVHKSGRSENWNQDISNLFTVQLTESSFSTGSSFSALEAAGFFPFAPAASFFFAPPPPPVTVCTATTNENAETSDSTVLLRYCDIEISSSKN